MTQIAYRYASRALANQFAEELKEAAERLQCLENEYRISLNEQNTEIMDFGELAFKYEDIINRLMEARAFIEQALTKMQLKEG